MTASYHIEVTASAARSMKKLTRPVQVRIARAIDSLALDPRPHGSVKLSGDDELYRVRVGAYRILYCIADKKLLILVVAIGHRREIYRK
jgi:mRNA interferase RelE/StbE